MVGTGAHRLSDSHCFVLLFVCTGNICRSPFAEVLTRSLLVGKLGGRDAAAFEIVSAGVRAVVGAPMDPDMRSELRPWRLDGERFAGSFRAQQLRPDLIEGADLVLGLSPGHRGLVVEQVPAALPMAFSLREFARLAASVAPESLPREPIERAHALVGLARQRRGMLPAVEPDADRVPDPMGGPRTDHHRAAQLIDAAARTIVDIVTNDR